MRWKYNLLCSRYFLWVMFVALLFSSVRTLECQSAGNQLEDIDLNETGGKFVAIFSNPFSFNEEHTPNRGYLKIQVSNTRCTKFLERKENRHWSESKWVIYRDPDSPVNRASISQEGSDVVISLHHSLNYELRYSSSDQPRKSTRSEMRPGKSVLWIRFDEKPAQPPEPDNRSIQLPEQETRQSNNSQQKLNRDLGSDKEVKSLATTHAFAQVLPQIPEIKVQKNTKDQTFWLQVVEVWRKYLRIPIDLIILLGLLRIALGLRRNHQIIREVVLREIPSESSNISTKQQVIEGNDKNFENLLQANLETANSDSVNPETKTSNSLSEENDSKIPVEEIDSTQIEEISDLEIEKLKEKAQRLRQEEGLGEAEIAQKLGVSGEKVALIFSLDDN